ncbi:hypothetical protein L895_14235 [Staphylococcus aureus SA16]|nr:hypothetical protein L895_14235 [Staphylococcus aureus SA16]
MQIGTFYPFIKDRMLHYTVLKPSGQGRGY